MSAAATVASAVVSEGQARPAAASPGAYDPERGEKTAYLASPYVPLDSWIYAVFDRLTAEGYAPSSSATIRPWTRMECARLLGEAHNDTEEMDSTVQSIVTALDAEFAHETAVINGAPNREQVLESAYSRITGISGPPLRDSFHFAQTLADDFGRPYGEGANEVSGLSGWGTERMFAVYLRGEHQYASAIPTYNLAAQQAIAAADSSLVTGGQIPFGWNLRLGTTDRARLLEGYALVNVANWQISFGQQSLWWGPDRSTSLTLSNNASSLPMLRLARAKPIKMPGILSWLGPVHFDGFFAREGGIHYVGLGPDFNLYGSPQQALTPPPYMWGVTFSFKPTHSFELGFAHTVIFAGYGRPLNLKTFLHTFSIGGNGQAVDPGKRVTEFNFAYHLPWMRRTLTIYDESMAWDDPAEGKFVARFAMAPGVYMPHFPGLKNVDLRMEGAYTNLPKLVDPAYFYNNAHYPQGYTNYGQIMGSWIGKQGQGGQVTSTYWFTPRSKVSLSYRKMTVDKSYLQGGDTSDVTARATWLLRPSIELSALGQYESWHFSLLANNPQSDFVSSFEVHFTPKLAVHFGANH